MLAIEVNFQKVETSVFILEPLPYRYQSLKKKIEIDNGYSVFSNAFDDSGVNVGAGIFSLVSIKDSYLGICHTGGENVGAK